MARLLALGLLLALLYGCAQESGSGSGPEVRVRGTWDVGGEISNK